MVNLNILMFKRTFSWMDTGLGRKVQKTEETVYRKAQEYESENMFSAL